MKSTVCKKANELIRKGYTRSRSFKIAWAIVKNNPEKINASELERGNVLRVEYGRYNNWVTCTINSVVYQELFYCKRYLVKAVSTNGMELDFCVDSKDKIERLVA